MKISASIIVCNEEENIAAICETVTWADEITIVDSDDHFVLPVAAFIRTCVLKQGFRDGAPGLIIAMFTAYSVFLKFAKVWERNNVKQKD